MKNQFVVAAAAVLAVSLGAARVAAQGPQGAEAGAATSGGAAKESSHKSHSLNPIKWVKKDSKATNNRLGANSDRDKKLNAKLQAQGLLPAGTELKDACSTFKDLGDCVAGLHASHNLGLSWNCLKWDLTAIQTGADMSDCKGPESDKGMSLGKAIHLLKPDADAKAEAKNAEKQAQADLTEASSSDRE